MQVSLELRPLSMRVFDIGMVIYYASDVFVSLGLTGGTTALLATGVTGVVFIISTVPAMVSRTNCTRLVLFLTSSSWSLTKSVVSLCF